MSLFDINSSGSSRSSSCTSSRSGSDGDDAGVEDILGALRRKRFELTSEEASKAEDARRQALEEKLAAQRGVAGASPNNNNNNNDNRSGFFGDSIASAMEMRRREKEAVLLRRIQQQRAQDAKNPEMVEKDLSVGVFVTAAYQQMIERQRVKAPAAAAPVAAPSTAGGRLGGDDYDDQDPLSAYLKKLEASKPVNTEADKVVQGADGSSRQDYYEAVMLAPLAGNNDNNNSISCHAGQSTAEKGNDETPSVSDLLEAIGAHEGEAKPTAGDDKDSITPNDRANTNTSSSETDAAAAHRNAVMVAREARKRQRADAVFIEGCARRCEERMRESLSSH